MEHMHKALKSLDWLEGTWRMRPQDDSNPIIKDFDYYEEISIKSLGQYMFNFTEQTFSNWDLKKPMHRERGFLKVDPKTNTIIFISALDTDLTMVEYGMISNNHMILNTMIGEIIKPYLIQVHLNLISLTP